MKDWYLTDGLRARLDAAVREAGGVSALARDLGVTPAFVSAAYREKRPPTGALARRIGALKETRYYLDGSSR